MKKSMFRALALMLVTLMALSLVACGGGDSKEPAASTGDAAASTPAAAGDDVATAIAAMSMDELIAAAKEEGDLQTVGMPPNWAAWKLSFDAFTEMYGITHTDLDMSSAEELAMFEAEKDDPTKDMGDVGFSFGPEAMKKGLTLPYVTKENWDSVPDWAKDPDGNWVVTYTGVTTFLANLEYMDAAPKSWQELRDGDMVVSIGDVMVAASAQGSFLAANFAFGGDYDNLEPGLEFWREMAEAGRIDLGDITTQRVQSGEVELNISWSFVVLPQRDNTPNYEFDIAVPSDAAMQVGYANVINAYSPHPHVACLFREYLLSDEGQIDRYRGYAVPVRSDVEIPADAQENGLPQDQLANANIIPLANPTEYAEVCARVAQLWEDEIVPLLG